MNHSITTILINVFHISQKSINHDLRMLALLEYVLGNGSDEGMPELSVKRKISHVLHSS